MLVLFDFLQVCNIFLLYNLFEYEKTLLPVAEGYRICGKTLKYFNGVANHKWVISVQWAVQCTKNDILLPEVNTNVIYFNCAFLPG